MLDPGLEVKDELMPRVSCDLLFMSLMEVGQCALLLAETRCFPCHIGGIVSCDNKDLPVTLTSQYYICPSSKTYRILSFF
jgi:hypothetical protein